MDALPISDEKEVAYRSTIPGIAHACGHDLHTAIQVGAALVLADLEEEEPYRPLQVDPAIEEEQAKRLSRLRAERDHSAVHRALGALKRNADGTENVLPSMKDALAARATVGEVCDALRDVWGLYVPPDVG
jgi:methylmalonyl-CoA mutase N-terminal domain/subunit